MLICVHVRGWANLWGWEALNPLNLCPVLCAGTFLVMPESTLGVKDGGTGKGAHSSPFFSVSKSHLQKVLSFEDDAPSTAMPCAHFPGGGVITSISHEDTRVPWQNSLRTTAGVTNDGEGGASERDVWIWIPAPRLVLEWPLTNLLTVRASVSSSVEGRQQYLAHGVVLGQMKSSI